MDAAALFVQSQTVKNLPNKCCKDQKQSRSCDYTKISGILIFVREEHAAYKYTVYRCASKIISLQKLLFTSNIPYKIVQALLGRYNILDVDANFMVPPFQLTTFIHDLYYACETLGHFNKSTTYRIEKATSVLATFFWNLFDPNRRHSISVLEIKVMFLLLSKHIGLLDWSEEFYNLLHDPKTKCVSKKNFEYLLNILTKMFSYIGEELAYGSQNKTIIMEQCFEKNSYGLTEVQFKNLWHDNRTKFSIFANLISLIKRMQDTEKITHNKNCAACNIQIIGIRFKCRSCHDLSLCLSCFAKGYVKGKHNVGHRLTEVFKEDESPKRISSFFASICNFFKMKKQSNEESKGFCNTDESTSVDETELEIIASDHTVKSETMTTVVEVKTDAIETSIAGLSTSASTASNVSEHLQSIIDRLLQQNSKLEKQIKIVKTATNEEISDFLQSHQNFLIGIINEMRRFSVGKELNLIVFINIYTKMYIICFQQISKSLSSYPTSSTPNRSHSDKAHMQNVAAAVDNFSVMGSNLTHSINGADLNRSYLEANKSDASVNDVSTWFNQRRSSVLIPNTTITDCCVETVPEISSKPKGNGTETDDEFEIVDLRDTDMINFKLLLNKVKEIVEDSFSDNTELAAATQNLENVLDNIVKNEEKRRSST
ncbi:dystrophin isoform X2 [Bactrocera neohumeralis]|uniref:dystrophin isoform X2 n=1 Tax=Bactrocera neohumeralis TaxID=98809 RepID=UPI0021668527|nr:dystrophin isoform X2 [Bactrocera neohumeralis]